MSRISLRQTLAYSCGALAAGVFLAFITYTFPYYLSENHLLIGWLAATRFLPIIQPVVGILSDRARFARSRLILAAIPVSALALLVGGLVPPEQSSFTLIVIAIIIAAFFFNVGITPYTALLADVTPSEQRGIVSGAAQGLGFLGQVALLIGAFFLYEYGPLWVFALVAVALGVGFGIVAFGVREKGREGDVDVTYASSTPPTARGFNGYLLGLLRDQPDAMRLLGTRLLYQIGMGAVLAFLAPFIATEIGLNGWGEVLAVFPLLQTFGLEKIDPQGLAQMMAGIFLLATGVFAFPSGWLGDKFGKKIIFAVGLLVFGIAAFFAASAASITAVIGYMTLLGLGNAALSVLVYPYLADLISPKRFAEFAGLSALVESAGLLLAFPTASAFINFNFFQMQYRLVFVFAALFVLFAFGNIMFVRGRPYPDPQKS